MINTPAVSPKSWLWWADAPCESTKQLEYNPTEPPGQLVVPARQLVVPNKQSETASLPRSDTRPRQYAGTYILTTIKPVDVALMSPTSRSSWELRNVFNHVYTTIQRVMRMWIDPCWKPVIDACFWSTIDASGGDPRVSNMSHRNSVFIGEAHDAITLKFGEPNSLFVTCVQWRMYTALTNALSRIQVTVREYEAMRARMPRPDDYVAIHLTQLFPSIDRDRYFVNQSECIDYERIDYPEATYPWPA